MGQKDRVSLRNKLKNVIMKVESFSIFTTENNVTTQCIFIYNKHLNKYFVSDSDGTIVTTDLEGTILDLLTMFFNHETQGVFHVDKISVDITRQFYLGLAEENRSYNVSASIYIDSYGNIIDTNIFESEGFIHSDYTEEMFQKDCKSISYNIKANIGQIRKEINPTESEIIRDKLVNIIINLNSLKDLNKKNIDKQELLGDIMILESRINDLKPLLQDKESIMDNNTEQKLPFNRTVLTSDEYVTNFTKNVSKCTNCTIHFTYPSEGGPQRHLTNNDHPMMGKILLVNEQDELVYNMLEGLEQLLGYPVEGYIVRLHIEDKTPQGVCMVHIVQYMPEGYELIDLNDNVNAIVKISV